MEAWLAKQTVLSPAGGSGGSSLNLGDEHDQRSGIRSGSSYSAAIDTVSNRDNDTLSGKSGSVITNLSTSDSGVLVRIAKNASASDTSSQIDLESEIARRSQLRSGHSSAHGGSTVVRAAPSVPLPGQPIAPAPAPLPDAPAQRALWIVGLAVMFVLAVLLGVLIARLTA